MTDKELVIGIDPGVKSGSVTVTQPKARMDVLLCGSVDSSLEYSRPSRTVMFGSHLEQHPVVKKEIIYGCSADHDGDVAFPYTIVRSNIKKRPGLSTRRRSQVKVFSIPHISKRFHQQFQRLRGDRKADLLSGISSFVEDMKG